ncbi:MAG: PAS domain S-box-containing protein [Alphaproteobacteria bacterium]|jgi:PAS domain S-box-containing protein
MPLSKILNFFNNLNVGKTFGGLHPMHWAILFLSLCLTFGTWYFAQVQIKGKISTQFERESNQVTSLILERMKKYENILLSGVAALDAKMQVSEWNSFTDTLRIEQRYPGINGVGIVYNLKNSEELAAFTEVQRQKRPDFKVHPLHDQREYWPITYIEPIELNAKAVGLDLAFETNRRTSILRAKDTGRSQMTGPIVLVQDSKKTPGFLFYVPRYDSKLPSSTKAEREKSFLDIVYAPFIMEKLMDGVLRASERHVTLRLVDVTNGLNVSNTLFDEHNLKSPSQDFDPAPQFKKITDIPLYGRIWRFEIHSGKSFRLATTQNTSLFILIGGIVIEVLLLLFLLNLSRTNQNSQVLAKDSQEFKNLMMEHNPDAVFVKDDRFRVVEANLSFLKLYSKQQTQALNKKTLDSYYVAAASSLEQDKEAFESGYSEIIEQIKLPTGDTRIFQTRKIRFQNDKQELFLLGVSRDVTERERLISQLTDSNIELERFAYVASHDLQEPIRMISNFTQILKEDCVDSLSEMNKKHFSFIEEGATRMQLLINSLLVYAKVGADNDDNDVLFDADEELNKVLDNLSDRISKHGAEIQRAKLPQIVGQPIHFSRILENLISNGIKYQPEDAGHIPVISIGCKESLHEWIFSIKDNGIGIEKKYWAKIFNPFQRLNSRASYEGTGIGLTLCKKIVEKGGGDIFLSSEAEQGTTFYFTIKKNNKGEA